MKKIICLLGMLMLLCATVLGASNLVEVYSSCSKVLFQNKISCNIGLKNTGDRIAEGLIEIQPRITGGTAFSIIQSQGTCDSLYPQNVHRRFTILPGETATVNLVTPSLNPNIYDIFLISTNQCCSEGSCQAISPFYWEKYEDYIVLGALQTTECEYSYQCPEKLNYECGNVNEGDYTCENAGTVSAKCSCIGETDPDPEPTGKPNFKIEIIDAPNSAFVSERIDYNVKVTNVGSAGVMLVDSGIYPQSLINNWYSEDIAFEIVKNIPNCKNNELNVDSKKITLSEGESTTVKMTIVAPEGEGTGYAFHAGSFFECGQAYQNYDAQRISLATKTAHVCTAEGDGACVDSEWIAGDVCAWDNSNCESGCTEITDECADETVIITQACNDEGNLHTTGLECEEVCIEGVTAEVCQKSGGDCEDDIWNNGEAGVDCGGECENECFVVSCEDNIKNGDELGVDCGGGCPECAGGSGGGSGGHGGCEKIYETIGEDLNCHIDFKKVFSNTGIKAFWDDYTWQLVIAGVVIIGGGFYWATKKSNKRGKRKR